MSDLKEIIWTSGDKFIPPYGLFKTGERKLLPESVASEFITSGKAETIRKKPSTEKSTPVEE